MRSGGVRQARPRIPCALTLLLVVLLAAQPAGVQGQDSPSPFDAAATQVVADITAGALSQVRASFDPTMAAQLPEDQLANAWRTYQELLGAFQSADSPTSAMQGALTVEQVPVHMTNGDGTIRIVFHPDGTIAGLFFLRAEGGAPPSACTIASPWPADFSRDPVSDRVEASAAAWLGVWEGTWKSPFPDFVARLGVERIEATRAIGVYAYPDQGGNPGGWIRFAGQRSGNRIDWDNGTSHFTFMLSADGQAITGEREQAGSVSRAAFARCAL